MMTPSWVTQEAARLRTEEQIAQAESHRRGKGGGAVHRRTLWTALAAVVRLRRRPAAPAEAEVQIAPIA